MRLLKEDYREKLIGEAEGLLKRAGDGVSVIQRLSHRLQTFAGVRRQGKPFEPVDCSAVLKQVIGDLGGLKKEEKVEIACDVMPQIFADPDQIGQVFQNLLRNAIKRCQKQPPKIHIGAEVNGANWVFSVRDNGPSVDVGTAEQLFLLTSPLHA